MAEISATAGVPRDAAPSSRARSREVDKHFPPPALNTLDLLWRYGLACSGWVLGLLTAGLSPALQLSWLRGHRWAAVTVVVLVGLLALLLIRQRRRRPVATSLAISLLASIDGAAGVFSDWALLSLATRRRPREVVPAALAFVACRAVAVVNPAAFNLITPSAGSTAMPSRWLLASLAIGGGIVEAALVVALGFYVGARRDLIGSLKEQVETTQREQELLVLHTQAEERNRIAREMHDVLAHRISLVAMHAGALAYRDDLSPSEIREVASTIQENAASSLTELRGVLGQLRTDAPLAAWSGPERPQPTLVDIGELVRDARAAGMRVDFESTIEHPETMPAQIGRHAYRIVQEALTNARKHAGGARVDVTLSGGAGVGLALVVRNSLRPGQALVPGSGSGLVGMRERAETVGGQLTIQVIDGYFDVRAWLPW